MFKLPVFGSRGKVDSNVDSHARGHVGERPPQPFSENTLHKTARIKDATVVEGVCPYCAVGCGQHIYTKGGQIIDIEGNPALADQRRDALPEGRERLPACQQPAPGQERHVPRAVCHRLGSETAGMGDGADRAEASTTPASAASSAETPDGR